MTARPPEVIGGLAVRKDHTGWTVVHVNSGLYVASSLRQRRFAEQARTEFLALDVDFTGTKGEVAAQSEHWRAVHAKWWQRARQEHLDLVTLEYYPQSTHYGQCIPSARRAEELRPVMAEVLAGLRAGEAVRGDTDDRYAVLRALEAAGQAVYFPRPRGWVLAAGITAESPEDLGERGEELAREERADCSS
jgi:hypothetical protein